MSQWRRVIRNYELYLFLLPAIIYFIVFQYAPMYGVQIAFREFIASKGIWDSPWVGFTHFERFFNSYQFWPVIKNTIGISLYELAVKFPIPIITALLLNQLVFTRYKRFIQTITYAPHFISAVVIAGMIYLFLSPRNGLVNQLLAAFGLEKIFFLAEASWFKSIFIFSGVWQETGWSMIIYLAALTAVNPELHEAAVMDGASKIKRIFHVDIPSIMPTIMILLILNIGSFMTVGFEKVYLLQNSLNQPASEIIQTYVYKTGLLGAQFSYSAAIGLFNSVVNCMLLLLFNYVAKRIGQTSLW
ncbi:ABC transporter permease subunit [Paenibacillus sp. PL2-23]|uniref:ABC transporter permease n=1 Tax=Paenibacillus sp. PL2-23 TaxID=2100729 RepID=UPI0030FA3F8E